ncbi:MAG: hypothetical protein LBC46_03200 [Treponema sp.]|nr:hypothetical protein [Treponema sp.]
MQKTYPLAKNDGELRPPHLIALLAYETFVPKKAFRVAQRLEIHYALCRNGSGVGKSGSFCGKSGSGVGSNSVGVGKSGSFCGKNGSEVGKGGWLNIAEVERFVL